MSIPSPFPTKCGRAVAAQAADVGNAKAGIGFGERRNVEARNTGNSRRRTNASGILRRQRHSHDAVQQGHPLGIGHRCFGGGGARSASSAASCAWTPGG